MSKAFTSEETPDIVPLVRAPPPRLAPGELRYVTPEGQAALRAERDALAPHDPRATLLEATLASLTVLGPEATPEGKVGFGSWVTVRDAAGARTTWRLVGQDEADPRHGLMSAYSPMGRALLGREVGDTVEVERPDGRADFEVLEVRRAAPAASGSATSH